MKRSSTAAALVALLLVAGACTSNTSTSEGSASATGDQEPLKVGFAIAQTGFLAFIDVPWYYGFKTAVDEINASGGVNGHMIEYDVKDTRTDPSQTTVV